MLRVIARLVLAACTMAGIQVVLATGALADPPANDWQRLRICESSNQYDIDNGNGYYGAYQFDLPTWQSVGGTGQPNLNPPPEQDYRALYLYRMRGWQPWSCATKLNLHNDSDAASQQEPAREDSLYMGGTPTPPGPMPQWPGVVYARGDCAPALRTFQLEMNHYGYDFDGTGCYFDKTQQAVLDLQRANGIRDSGRLGPKTWQAAWLGRHPHP